MAQDMYRRSRRSPRRWSWGSLKKQPWEAWIGLGKWTRMSFENNYLRAHAEMQNIQRRANEDVKLCNVIVARDLAKAILLPDNLELHSQLKVWQTMSKRIGDGARKLDSLSWKKKNRRNCGMWRRIYNYHMAIQTLPADDEHQQTLVAQVFQKGYKLHDRILRPAMVQVVYN